MLYKDDNNFLLSDCLHDPTQIFTLKLQMATLIFFKTELISPFALI